MRKRFASRAGEPEHPDQRSQRATAHPARQDRADSHFHARTARGHTCLLLARAYCESVGSKAAYALRYGDAARRMATAADTRMGAFLALSLLATDGVLWRQHVAGAHTSVED